MTQRIVPNIWFAGNAEAAGDFYAGILPRTTSTVTAAYPADVPDWQASFAGQPLVVELDIDGYRLALINAGDEFRPNPSTSFMLNFDPLRFEGDREAAQARMDAVWEGLSDGGRVLMPLGAYPFSPHYGWIEDRYGVSWQLILTNPEGEPRPFVIPQLMFCGPVQGAAREAAAFYTSLLPGSEVGFTFPYPEAQGPAAAGDVMFGEFLLAGQWFSMMDSAVEQEFTFSPGISFEVACADQAEIDRLWEALSAVPEAEQCGWLADRYGLSWQIVPANMAELMARPGAYGRMMEMTKLVIDEF